MVLIATGCHDSEPDITGYTVMELSVSEGEWKDGLLVKEPAISIKVAGPDDREWNVCCRDNEITIAKLSIRTNEPYSISLAGIITGEQDFRKQIWIDITLPDSEEKLVSKRLTVIVNDMSDKQPVIFTSLSVKTDDGNIKTLSSPTDTLKLACEGSGLFYIEYEPFDDKSRVDVIISSDDDNSLSIDLAGKTVIDNHILCLPFTTQDMGSGIITFKGSRGQQTTVRNVPYFVLSSEVPEPDQPEETAKVSLSVPHVMFEWKPVNLSCIVSAAGIEEFFVNLSVDGDFVESKHIIHEVDFQNNNETIVTFGIEEGLKKGSHTFSVDILLPNETKPVTSAESKGNVSTFRCEWFSNDSEQKTSKLYFKTKGSPGKLKIYTDCNESEILSYTVSESVSGSKLTKYKEDDTPFACHVPYFTRGSHTFIIEFETTNGVYQWEEPCSCFDIWTCIFGIENEKSVFYSMYGPENSFPISLNVKIGIWLEAYIQYQEAVIVNGEYVTQTKDTFESIGYYNEFGNIEKGTVKLQKKEIYNGKFSPLINYLNSQAKKIPIAKNSASRWVSNGKGGYTKEFFTPTAVPGIYIIITSDEQQYAPSEFIDVTFDLEAVQKYFTSKGVNYRDYQL